MTTAVYPKEFTIPYKEKAMSKVTQEEVMSLRGWWPDESDCSHIKENPFKVIEGKQILRTHWMPGGVDLEFCDGSKGYIDIMIHRDQFNVECGKMMIEGELFITAGLRE